MKFATPDSLKQPHGNTIIWRYMTLDKFLDLLTHSRLFFTNAMNLTDEYDVTLPENTIAKKRKELKSQGLKDRDLEEELAVFQYNHHPMRELTLVNCWSMGRNESYALWKIYLDGSSAGVSVRSSFSKLKNSVVSGDDPYPEEIYSGVVQYKNFIPEKELSRYRLITTKRKFYKYEKEVRLFVINFPRSEGGTKTPYNMGIGRHVNVDLGLLIDKIYVSPFAGPWLYASLEKVIQKFQPTLSGKLKSSAIRDR